MDGAAEVMDVDATCCVGGVVGVAWGAAEVVGAVCYDGSSGLTTWGGGQTASLYFVGSLTAWAGS
jgi:hypothetical protein